MQRRPSYRSSIRMGSAAGIALAAFVCLVLSTSPALAAGPLASTLGAVTHAVQAPSPGLPSAAAPPTSTVGTAPPAASGGATQVASTAEATTAAATTTAAAAASTVTRPASTAAESASTPARTAAGVVPAATSSGSGDRAVSPVSIVTDTVSHVSVSHVSATVPASPLPQVAAHGLAKVTPPVAAAPQRLVNEVAKLAPSIATAPQDVVSGVAKLAPSLASVEALASGLPAAMVNGVAKLPTSGLPQMALTEVAKLPPSIVAAPPDVVSGVTSLAPTVAQLAGRGDEAVTQVVSFTHAVAPVLGTQPATDSAGPLTLQGLAVTLLDAPTSGAIHVIATQALPTERWRATTAAGPPTTSPTGASGPNGALALTTPASTAAAPNPPAGAVATLPGATSDAAEADGRGAQMTGSASTRASGERGGVAGGDAPGTVFRLAGDQRAGERGGDRRPVELPPPASAPSGTPASAAGSASTGFSLTIILVGLLALGAAWAWRRTPLADFLRRPAPLLLLPDPPG